MASVTSALISRAERRVRRDPRFAEVLATLVNAPTRSAGAYRHAAARALNEERFADTRASFQSGALPTAEVQRLLGLGTPQAVHRLRSRGRLIAAALGNATWFPAWQFSNGAMRPGLPGILELLGRFSSDPVAADRVMRLVRDELGGLSIADALDDAERGPIAWAILGQLSG